ncbi:MAG: PQQ-dependent sugar dehydrogenase [Agriterribacter sp.]
MRKKVFASRCSVLLCSLLFLPPVVLLAQPDVGYELTISSGISMPMEVASAPGDASQRLFIVEKEGLIKIWNGSTILSTPFLDISAIITKDGERGLLSMAFHPAYAQNGFFFVYYTNASGAITVGRYKVSSNPDVAEPTSDPATPLVTIAKSYANHNGGRLQFRTESGKHYLYFGTGDGGSGNDPQNNAQNTASLLGKMIRMDVDADPVVPELWAVGLRNPFRWSFDKSTGDMWIGDVGQGRTEEINFRANADSGANYGWRCFEGSGQNTDVNPLCNPPGKTAPIFEYANPSQGRSVVGGYVYRGTEFPDLQGYYLATDYFSGNLWRIKQESAGSFTISPPVAFKTAVSSFSETQDGTLYITALEENRVYKVIQLNITPLRIISFSGLKKEGSNILKWTTSIEQGIQKFEIEYSDDGNVYLKAGEVNAINNINGASYEYEHHINIGSKIFYRLHIINSDGSASYSPVISLDSVSTSNIKVYPTVVENNILHIVSEGNVDEITLFGLAGNRVFTRKMNGLNGYFPITLPSLQKGTYVIRIAGKNFQRNQKIIIR